jgi:hypothetical protein
MFIPRSATPAHSDGRGQVAKAKSKAAPEAAPQNQAKTGIEILADVVIDHDHGLMWTRDNLPGGRASHATIAQAASDCRIGGFDDWQLPSPQQALTLVDYSKFNPCVDTTAFPSCKPNAYWTNTECAFDASFVWVVYFDYGPVYYFPRDGDSAFGRAVRRVSASQ